MTLYFHIVSISKIKKLLNFSQRTKISVPFCAPFLFLPVYAGFSRILTDARSTDTAFYIDYNSPSACAAKVKVVSAFLL